MQLQMLSNSQYTEKMQRLHLCPFSVFGESGQDDMVGLGSPYFQSREGGGGVLNVTTQLEASTYLHCRVNRLGGKTVSLYLLTI